MIEQAQRLPLDSILGFRTPDCAASWRLQTLDSRLSCCKSNYSLWSERGNSDHPRVSPSSSSSSSPWPWHRLAPWELPCSCFHRCGRITRPHHFVATGSMMIIQSSAASHLQQQHQQQQKKNTKKRPPVAAMILLLPSSLTRSTLQLLQLL